MTAVLYLWCAVAASILTALVHIFIGGKFVARPLLADTQLPSASKWLNYYCWHVTTIMIIALGIGFYLCIKDPSNVTMIAFLSALATASSLLSAAIAIKATVNPFRFPSTSLFAATALFGWLALFA